VGNTERNCICPTCETQLPEDTQLVSLGGDLSAPRTDDVRGLCEQAGRLVGMLGALAAAAPRAVTDYCQDVEEAPDWYENLCWLAEELEKETQHRLSLVITAAYQCVKECETGARKES
jgi:hypothetical protein